MRNLLISAATLFFLGGTFACGSSEPTASSDASAVDATAGHSPSDADFQDRGPYDGASDGGSLSDVSDPLPDGSLPDTALPDGSSPDSSLLDGSLPDSGSPWPPGWGPPTWSDEFDYHDPTTKAPAVDPSKWNIRDASTFGHTFDAANISAANVSVDAAGILHIRGTWRQSPVVSTTGATGNPTYRWMDTGYIDHRIIKPGDVAPYSQQYGRWEVRAKVDTGSNTLGALCAFWLRNEKPGEVDIMESWGWHEISPSMPGQYPGTSTLTIHSNTSGAGSKNPDYQKIFWRPHTELNLGGGARSLPTPPVYEDFHVWGFEYTPAYLSADFDGQQYVYTTPAENPWLWQSASFDGQFHVRINLHLGPSVKYWGLPDPDHKDWTHEIDYQVDYVRIWKWEE